MKRSSILRVSGLFIVFLFCMQVRGRDVETISFATVESTERARTVLREKGLFAFMDIVWNQGVAAPGIHSKYWLDQFTRGNPDLYAVEKSYRDFGLEVAVQIENLAFEIYEKPVKSLEIERLDWLLRFSKWFLKPGRFENYRIGMRAESAALMPFMRVIFDLDIPIEKVEQYIGEFTTTKKNAVLRAGFLYEESAGVFDVRDLAEKAKPGQDDGFQKEWIKFTRRAYLYFGGELLHYTTDPEILLDEKIEYSFFMDDNREIGGWNSIPGRWDEKYHRQFGVFGGHTYAVRIFCGIIAFRRDIGEFPDVEIQSQEDPLTLYRTVYQRMYKGKTRASAGTVGDYYWKYKNNQYMDDSTLYSYISRNAQITTLEMYERFHLTKLRRARNQQWLKKNRK